MSRQLLNLSCQQVFPVFLCSQSLVLHFRLCHRAPLLSKNYNTHFIEQGCCCRVTRPFSTVDVGAGGLFWVNPAEFCPPLIFISAIHYILLFEFVCVKPIDTSTEAFFAFEIISQCQYLIIIIIRGGRTTESDRALFCWVWFLSWAISSWTELTGETWYHC